MLPSSHDGTTGFRLSGAAALDYSGWSVASAGDVNGDGFDDMLVGARYADPNGDFSGASYVVFGKHTTAPVARIGSDASERMTGGSAGDVLAGMDGDDRLYGNEGNDNLLGGDGNDVLRGGAGDDNMSGGTGDDLYYVDSSEDIVAEFLGQGTDTVHTTASFVLGQHVENLIADWMPAWCCAATAATTASPAAAATTGWSAATAATRCTAETAGMC